MPVIAADDLYRFYHAREDETRALRGVSFAVEAGEFVHLTGDAVEKRYSTKAAAGSTGLIKKYSGGGRAVQLSTMEIQGRPTVIYADVPAGANPNIINPAQVTLKQ